MIKAKELLIEARKVIADPNNWSKRWVAVNKTGKPVQTTSPDAVAFCSIGAISITEQKLYGYENSIVTNLYRQSRDPAVSALNKFMPGTIGGFQEIHTHAEVLEAWDKAINSL